MNGTLRTRQAASCPAAYPALNVEVLRATLMLAAVLSLPVSSSAQALPRNLAEVSIEDLMDIQITSVSHKTQRAGDAAAAVHVITQEDIRRSGMTMVAELLRMVPGVQVAQINSNKWAVSIRGFNNLFSDKLLVLVDGRPVYDRLNSGLFWEGVGIPLDQIERIEVVRGPGGATWGANAVNGVINIISKSATNLPGAAISIGGGLLDERHAAVRYGGAYRGVAYRLFSQWSGYGASRLDADTSANDSWRTQTHGVRLDWNRGPHALTVDGGVTLGWLRSLWKPLTGPVPAIKPRSDDVSDASDYHLVSRWTRSGEIGTLKLQSVLNFRRDHDVISPTQWRTEIDAQYQRKMGTRHDLVVGTGYRIVDEKVEGGFRFSIDPNHVSASMVHFFAQDEIALGSRLKLTLGTKVERDSYAGWGVQPTARLMWTVVPLKQHLWTAVSRALRTPSLGEMLTRNNFTSVERPGQLPAVIGALGNIDLKSEAVVSTEVGYRWDIGPSASVDATAFVGRYSNLKTSEALVPRVEDTPAPLHLFIPVQFENRLEATTFGVEVGAHWRPAAWWRVDGGYWTFRLNPRLAADSHDAAAAAYDGNAPHAQWHARSAFSFPRGIEADILLFHADALPNLAIAAYTRTDARLEVPFTRRLSFSVRGHNLFDRVHAEYGGVGAIAIPTLVARSASISLAWRQRP